MKREILVVLFLLTFFCVAPVLSQEKTSLVTEFIKLNNIKLPDDSCYRNECELDEKTKNFLSFFQRLLSKRGYFEFDYRNQTLIFTDTKNRTRLIKEFTGILDNSGFTLDEFVSETAKDEKFVTETVKANYIFPINSCFTGVEHLWVAYQGILLIGPMYRIKVRIKTNRNEAEITGTEKRVGLAKKIIALFDQPFLTEEIDYDF